MKQVCLSKLPTLCFTLTLLATGGFDIARATQDSVTTGEQEHSEQGAPHLNGIVSDIITAGGITYVEIDTGKEKVWAAGAVDDSLGKGDAISVSTTMPMENFHSKSLNRDFPVIYFVQQFMTGNQAPKDGPAGQAGKPRATQPTSRAATRTPGEVVEGSILRNASLDGLNTENRALSEYRGKPLIINVWASWCGPCRDEMDSLERLAKRYNGKMFNIIGISTDDYRDRASAFIDHTKVSFENYIDHALLMENMLGANTIPLTVLVNADGRVLMKVRGSREWDSPEVVEAIGNVFEIELI
jgi:thiol-disulfide isomerase/thioredoxin